MGDEQPRRQTAVRKATYFLFAVAAATPSPDPIIMFAILLAGIILFEMGYFAYRRRTSP